MDTSFETILCATDFSKFSKPVVAYAAKLARRLDARLVIFHAISYPRNPLHGTAAPRKSGEPYGPEKRAQERIERLMQGCPANWQAVIRHGAPVDEIHKYVTRHATSLVVAASYGLPAWKRLLLGTVVEQLARSLPVPVLVVSPGSRIASEDDIAIDNILVCCDLKKHDAPLFDFALPFSQAFDAGMHFVHAVAAPLDTDVIDPTAGPYEEVQQVLQEQLSERLIHHLPEDVRNRPAITTAVLPGIAAELITAYAREKRIDLIIVGVLKRSVLKKVLIGSTTETLLRRAPCAILTVPQRGIASSIRSQRATGTRRQRTGIVRDSRFLDHRTQDGHPENHRRLASIYRMLDNPDMRDRFANIVPRAAAKEELLMAHTPEHLAKIMATQDKECIALTPDTHTSPGSYIAATLAVGGTLQAISMVAAGQLENAFALVRPPGHHAEKSRAMGYCLFNNAALGAMYARNVLGMHRVLIVDWDVHHGNGTQHLFEQDDTVLFFSIHQYPHFPGTGVFTEAGIGTGEGFTVNVPIPKKYGDSEYAAIFEFLLRPIALEFDPELIIVSAGFDIDSSDPLGSMRITPNGFAALTRSLMETAAACCDGKMVLVLEGGYESKTIGAAVKAVLNELSGATVCNVAKIASRANRKKLTFALKRSVNVHRQHWKCLSHPLEVEHRGRTIRI